jgi:hypothetical protein
MTKAAYMAQRAPYNRPQGMLWADNYGSLVAYPSSINMITNSNFETDTTGAAVAGWTSTAGVANVKSIAQFNVGTASCRITVPATTFSGIYTSARISLETNNTYTFSAYIKDDATNPTAVPWTVSVVLYNALTGGAAYATTFASTAVTPSTSSWTRYSVTFIVPTGYTYGEMSIKTNSTVSLANKIAYTDGALLQEGSTVNPYVDGTLSAKYFYAPTGNEVYDSVAGDDFLIVSDHNRGPLDFKVERIEKRERMINGRMRSYHVADKLTVSTSWNNLPSRSFATDPAYDPATGTTLAEVQYTVDGGAGGADLLKWYEDHQGPFWVYLSYDNPNNFATDRYNHLDQYSEVIQMYISDFSWTVEKRGGRNYDFWNVNVTLEEV